ncbi:unnamed protein product [Protopolystoma xenopodis]|uniref:Reverse transcriptase domain-containing protein n=1 Tax=Protopolystoma xenopodis TaxID=117903 RepID=A0A448XDV8_9PLAT|nr:unnamed protein product [Protopolystoma xenopodis]
MAQEETDLLVSFDVESKFTNISGENALTALLEMLDREDDMLESQRIRRESLTRLINLTMRTTYFTFNGNIYEQIFGLAMGSPYLNTFGKRRHEQNRRALQDGTATTGSAHAVPGWLFRMEEKKTGRVSAFYAQNGTLKKKLMQKKLSWCWNRVKSVNRNAKNRSQGPMRQIRTGGSNQIRHSTPKQIRQKGTSLVEYKHPCVQFNVKHQLYSCRCGKNQLPVLPHFTRNRVNTIRVDVRHMTDERSTGMHRSRRAVRREHVRTDRQSQPRDSPTSASGEADLQLSLPLASINELGGILPSRN